MPYAKWDKFWATHNKIIVLASVLAFAFSGFCVVYAYSLNNYADSLTKAASETANIQTVNNQTNNTPKMFTGETYFEVPNIVNNNTNWDAEISCTLYTNNGRLAQDSIVTNMTISIQFGPTLWNTLRVLSIEVKPVGSINVYESWDYRLGSQYNILYPTSIYLWEGDALGASQVWSGYNWQESIFQNAGLVALQLEISAIPSDTMFDYANWDVFNQYYRPYFTKTVSLPLNVESTESILVRNNAQQQIAILQALNQSQVQTEMQQQIYDVRTRSLTFFVLFFASVDIGVVIFDHSKDEDKKAEYEKKRAEEEYLNKIKQINDVV